MPINTVIYQPNRCSNPVGFPRKSCRTNGTVDAGMPAKFQVADGTSTFAMGRNIYTNTTTAQAHVDLKTLFIEHPPPFSYQTGRQITNKSTRGGKPFNIESSNDYIARKRNQAIGKGSMPGQTHNNGSTRLSFIEQPNISHQTARSALRRVRNSGNVPRPNSNPLGRVITACSGNYPYCR